MEASGAKTISKKPHNQRNEVSHSLREIRRTEQNETEESKSVGLLRSTCKPARYRWMRMGIADSVIHLRRCWSQWSQSVRQEMSSPAQTLGSWVRIPLEVWMSAFIMCVILSDRLCGLVVRVHGYRSRVRLPVLPDFLRSSGSGTGSTQPREYNWGATWMEK
jgi:hypothetical protein